MASTRFIEIMSTDRDRQMDGTDGQNAFNFKIKLHPEEVPNAGFDAIRDVAAVSLMEFVAPSHLVANEQTHLYIRLKYNQRYLKTMDAVAACRDDIFARFSIVTDRSFRSLGSGNLVTYQFPRVQQSRGVPANRLSLLQITLLDENGCPIERGVDLYPLDYRRYGATLHGATPTGTLTISDDGVYTLNSTDHGLVVGDALDISGETATVTAVGGNDQATIAFDSATIAFDSATFENEQAVTWSRSDGVFRFRLESSKHLLLDGDQINVGGVAATVKRLNNVSSGLIETSSDIPQEGRTNVTWHRTKQSFLRFSVDNVVILDQHARRYRVTLTDTQEFSEIVTDEALGYRANQYCEARFIFASGGSRTEHLWLREVEYVAATHQLTIDVVLPFFNPNNIPIFGFMELSRFGDSAKPLRSSFLFRLNIRPQERS